MNAFTPSSRMTASPETGDVRLDVRGVHKKLGDTAAVDGIDLTVRAGESVVLLGPSGCGKTTTLRMIAGFLQPDAGEIHLDGQLACSSSFSLPPERRKLGMVFQTYAVWPHKTVAQNVAYGLVVAGKKRREVDEEVQRVLKVVQLGDYAKRYPSELSGGQQQRVALARAIATRPSLLLLDEPLSNLDAALRQEMRFELKNLHKRIGITTVYVTHDQDEALVLADRVVVMNRGKIEQIASPEEVYRNPVNRFVASFIGTANLLEGMVIHIDRAAGRAAVALEAGSTLWARAGREWLEGASEGARATVLIRPEHASLEPPGEAEDGTFIEVVREASYFLGNRYDLQLSARGVPLRVESRTPGRFDDDRARLWLPAEAARVVA